MVSLLIENNGKVYKNKEYQLISTVVSNFKAWGCTKKKTFILNTKQFIRRDFLRPSIFLLITVSEVYFLRLLRIDPVGPNQI